ncbi:hypothetical protein BpHYR1_028822 [Brachionus plicatilis]|uniref:Uncharacterized protein n=1 Tax=Brachionus plicatilis TaxID=10195 RepID=A0A3M7SDX4_BRAPC|nr:hypothetical protein BpHYR1_028822 [Brachionus plicatilis]
MENEITKICAEARRTFKKCQHEKTSPTSPKPTLLRNTIQTSQLVRSKNFAKLNNLYIEFSISILCNDFNAALNQT